MNEIRRALEVLRNVDFKEIQRLGFHFQANDYYSPLNDCQFLDANRDLWVDPYEPRDIEWNLNGQMDIAREVAVYVNELADIPYDPPSGQITYHWNNNFWNNADALVQYGLIRSRQPKRVIEIGCGWSSLLLARALKRNAVRCQVLQIEPYPNAAIFEQLPSDWVHLHCILQRASPEIFDRLEPGDLLFYDGSHCSKVASDVNWFFFRILPRLRSGVLIHLHDVFFPYDYPDEWIFKRGQTWNEQYVLQAFLMNNSKYRIVIANRYLFTHCKQELDKLYQGVQPSHGVSLWMKKL